MAKISKINAREVLDSRGFPTVEADVYLEGQPLFGRAIVPSGASTGEGEALELRDGDAKRFLGKGVLTAVKNIQEKITPALLGRDILTQAGLDQILLDLDGTKNKSHLGANAILAVSMGYLRAEALSLGEQVFERIAKIQGSPGVTLPVPLMNIVNGGKHADNGLNIQEFMIVPSGFDRFSTALRAGCEIFQRLKKILHDKGLSTGVGDEGGFAPFFSGEKIHEQALVSIMQAISDAGYKPGKQVFLALDCAASEFCDSSGNYTFEGKKKTSKEMIVQYGEWLSKFPIISIEDGLAEHDWSGWEVASRQLGNQTQLVGDDLFVTNPVYLKKGIDQKIANSILIKLNQIGTVTETLETIKMAHAAGYTTITSHRSGESEDTFISDLAVGTDSGQIKTGSASRTDRLAKYNQLLRIEEILGPKALFKGTKVYQKN